jgi:MATE family multidrug resistance protein
MATSSSTEILSPTPDSRSLAVTQPSFAQECKETITLALPLIAGQVGQMLMGVADTVMIGRLGVTELGAATVGNTLLAVPFVIGIGLLSSVSVRVSQARGADRPHDAGEALRHGTALALGLRRRRLAADDCCRPVPGALASAGGCHRGLPGYLWIITCSLIPAMLSMTWKNHADALNHPWPPFFILLAGVGLNVLLNWLWIGGTGAFLRSASKEPAGRPWARGLSPP